MAALSSPYIHSDFLLHTRAAQNLFHEYAEAMPVYDYHCHLPPAEVASDRRWDNLAQLWLEGDHYKWRAMRSNGVDENLITGGASDREKFQAWVETMSSLVRSPLYDWTHLELARYFGITKRLEPATADEIWEQTRSQLALPEFSARALMSRSLVRVVCTTDDPAATLEHHSALAAAGVDIRMLPTWRPDKALLIDQPARWNAWLDRLAESAGTDIRSLATFLDALGKRHAFFAAAGCRISDYSLATVPDVPPCSKKQMASIFAKARSGGSVTPLEADRFRFEVLAHCGRMDAAAGWVWQIHYGVLRDVNTRQFASLGHDAGFDVIDDQPVARGLARLFDRLDRDDALPPTIVYPLNPCDNELLASLIGAFQRGPLRGKMQLGSGWWFNDQKDGMRRQLEALSQLGLLGNFVGMLTDSRSFTSYVRHEYFRRILCALLGDEMERGDLPDDPCWIGSVVQDIASRNAVRYFGF